MNETTLITSLRKELAKQAGKIASQEIVIKNLNAVILLAIGEKGAMTISSEDYDVALVRSNEHFTLHIRRESQTSNVEVKVKTIEEIGLSVPKGDA